ncbi:uncharacterized protein PHALS_02987 [Plasmopara halstedii]|uniref:Uncharacterized protein n=1 Tax=Plasmopara halstedii TaxID=4781 RepID=A0A0P1A7I0_PLAHL|nr:uncharacterized protein PHALS_02987 [Plasmopara halstedii]CEG36437.1 hypothetical protein PHALS_02987 [Plasmopara halstedii]|eukprot:XP_024572806.1 hypothetical protein PHALS_02987 [Plasmopara halstedii]
MLHIYIIRLNTRSRYPVTCDAHDSAHQESIQSHLLCICECEYVESKLSLDKNYSSPVAINLSCCRKSTREAIDVAIQRQSMRAE